MMALVTVLEPDVVVDCRSGALRCILGRAVLRVLRPHTVDALHLHGSATLTPGARALLLREGIDVVFCTRNGRVLGHLCGPTPPGGDRRLHQYRTLLDPERRLALARWFVVGKLANQRALLISRRQGADDAAVESLASSLAAARTAPDLDALRGHEGNGARAYFRGFGRIVRRDDLTFAGRNRRPPRDPINAMLSYGYSLLVTRVEHAIRRVGLDPYAGALHEAGRGAPSLALDLAEEWRPLVDTTVLTLVNRLQVGPDDFRTPLAEEVGDDEVEAVYLDRVAKEVLVRAWERRIRTTFPHPENGNRWTGLDLFTEQARQASRAFEAHEPAYAAVQLWSS